MAYHKCHPFQDGEPTAEQARLSGAADSGNARLDVKRETLLQQVSVSASRQEESACRHC